MTIDRLLELMNDEDIQIIDIREPYEFEDSSIDNSVNVPMDDIAQNPEKINKQTVLVCQTGKRAESLCYILKEMHQVVQVDFLEGGYEAFIDKTTV